MINSLFDKDRKARVRDAVNRDKALPGIKKAEPLPETLTDMERGRIEKLSDPIRTSILNPQLARLNLELAQAVMKNDLVAISNAILAGADVNCPFEYDIVGRTPYNPKDLSLNMTFIIEIRTPLALAIDLGFFEAATLLRASGAKG